MIIVRLAVNDLQFSDEWKYSTQPLIIYRSKEREIEAAQTLKCPSCYQISSHIAFHAIYNSSHYRDKLLKCHQKRGTCIIITRFHHDNNAKKIKESKRERERATWIDTLWIIIVNWTWQRCSGINLIDYKFANTTTLLLLLILGGFYCFSFVSARLDKFLHFIRKWLTDCAAASSRNYEKNGILQLKWRCLAGFLHVRRIPQFN